MLNDLWVTAETLHLLEDYRSKFDSQRQAEYEAYYETENRQGPKILTISGSVAQIGVSGVFEVAGLTVWGVAMARSLLLAPAQGQGAVTPVSSP